MKNKLSLLLIASTLLLIASCHSIKENDESEENEKYDSPAARDLQEINKTKDPATGTVPIERLWDALDYTLSIKQGFTFDGVTSVWQERGPIYDSVGPSNSNGRGGGQGYTGGYTSGRISAIMVDISDPTGNTVFCGGVAGGIWKCTNFASTTDAPNWVQINDYLSNMSIVSLCQNPVHPDSMYAATGEASGNLDAVRGKGLFRSIDHGASWTSIPVTTTVRSTFKILCDAKGYLYWATSANGLRRSTNGGTTFSSISPSGASNACTSIEISSTGKLHASFGYGSSTVVYRFNNNPATASSSNWVSGTGSPTVGDRLELSTKGDTVYGVTTSTAGNIDYCYRSLNGGANWTKMNSTAYPTSMTNSQGWYAVSLAVNPADATQIIVGSVDSYLSTDGGATVNQITNWVGGGNFVHADHHNYKWWLDGNSVSKIIMASDGGLFYSDDGGSSFVDKNKNLGLKQFYSCAVHPTAGKNYIIGGAQDNGIHQLKNAGLSYSFEVTGGDGAYVDIDQDQPQYQFGSYVYNVYRRSSNSGATWTSFNFNSSVGQAGDFINTFDYDDVQNIFLAENNSGDFWRWTNPQSASSTSNAVTTVVSLTELSGNATAIQVSPYTTGRAFFGSSSGNVVMVNNTKTTTGSGSSDVVSLGQPTGGNINCIAVGTNDSNLLAVYTNYGISNLWITSDMGATWTAIDGNLPDMPVRWAVFHPTLNNQIVIATEAGVFTTTNVNGASTQWAASPGFPLVRTDMLKVRKNDNTIIAATHGRGMWSSNILSVLPLKNISLTGKLQAGNNVILNWQMIDATSNAKYVLQYSEDAIHFNKIVSTNNSIHSFTHQLNSDVGYYRVMGVEQGSAPIYSNIVAIKSNKNNKVLQITVAPNPLNNSGRIFVQSNNTGEFTWKICNVQGSVLQTGKGNLEAGALQNINATINKLSAGMYVVTITQNNQTKTASFVKQ